MKNRTYLSILLFSLLLTPACSSDDVVNGDDDDNGDVAAGEVSMEASGAVEAEFSGQANYTTLVGAAYFVTFTFDDGAGSASMTIEGVATEGSYEIGQTLSEPVKLEVNLSAVAALDGTLHGNTIIETGSVTITDLEDNRVEGRFTGTGETSATGNPELTVEGEFVATCFEAPGITCQL